MGTEKVVLSQTYLRATGTGALARAGVARGLSWAPGTGPWGSPAVKGQADQEEPQRRWRQSWARIPRKNMRTCNRKQRKRLPFSLINSFNEYILSTTPVLGTLLGAKNKDIAVNRQKAWWQGAYTLGKEERMQTEVSKCRVQR